jgi:methylenetetrahydrofolate dehydrogenase (NADP+)/methenyltetrahydrofolate cyclohydrolase
MILDGKAQAKKLSEDLCLRVKSVSKTLGRPPLLVTIQVGNDKASTSYVNMKAKACQNIGIRSKQIIFSDATLLTTADIVNKISELNAYPEVDGILVQHPLPMHIDERACFDAIDISKDVDGVTSLSFGKLAMGVPTYPAATPAAIMAILATNNIHLAGKNAVVVGRSPILGKPIAALLLNANATVTVCHSKTQNLPSIIYNADIVIGAVGKPNFIRDSWLKDGTIVIDAGYHPDLKTGDIELGSIKHRAYAYTPVPGGVGPMTISMLLEHTLKAAEIKAFSNS